MSGGSLNVTRMVLHSREQIYQLSCADHCNDLCLVHICGLVSHGSPLLTSLSSLYLTAP